MTEAEYAARFEHRITAYLAGYCSRCGRDVDPTALVADERFDWEVSATCPQCVEANVKKGEDCHD